MTLAELQRLAAPHGLWLPVDAPPAQTVRELMLGCDGGPREARYGRLRDRTLAVEMRGRRFGSEAVKDVAGLDVRRALAGVEPISWAVFRLARLPEVRAHWVATGGRAFSLAETLRADAAAPAALVVCAGDELLIASDHDTAEDARRRGLIEASASSAGASLDEISHDDWLNRCAALPQPRSRMTGTAARAAAAETDVPWAFDAGRRLAHGSLAHNHAARAVPSALVRAVEQVLT